MKKKISDISNILPITKKQLRDIEQGLRIGAASWLASYVLDCCFPKIRKPDAEFNNGEGI